jgi:hypothetical protein
MKTNYTLPCGLCGVIAEIMVDHEDILPTKTICNKCLARADVINIFNVVEEAIAGDSYLKLYWCSQQVVLEKIALGVLKPETFAFPQLQGSLCKKCNYRSLFIHISGFVCPKCGCRNFDRE